MKRFSISTLFWIVVCCALGLGWWINSPKPSETFYLHVYANYYQPHQDGWHPLNDRPENVNVANTRIATVAIHSSKEFYFNSPIDRNPELEVRGIANRMPDGNEFECKITFWFDDPSSTFEYEHLNPITVDKLTPFFGNYYFAISRQQDPYSLDYAATSIDRE